MTGTTVHIPTLVTERLTLRAPGIEDLEAYAAFCASPRTKWLGGPFDRAQAFQRLSGLIGHWHLRGYGRWTVADRDSGAALGVVGLMYPEDWPEPEIAWSLFDAAEERGIAQEAALAARAYAYDTLGCSSVISCVAPENTRSVALAERMGCTFEGIHAHPSFGDLHIWRHPSAAECAA